jgi:predicted nucleic acid-binding protein
MELPVCNNPVVFNVACRLAKTYEHHLFETLYHAVALSQDNTTLVTADLTYLNKVRNEGKIIPLSDFKLV